MSKKKKIIIAGSIVGAIIVIGVLVWLLLGRNKSGSKEDAVYVQPIAQMMGLGSGMGMPGRFSGVVESQDTWEIQKSQEKTIDELLVEVGQEVEAGTPLFTYDTSTMESDLRQAELDVERIDNTISNLNSQVKQLEKDKKEAGEDEKLSYTTQIQTAQMDMKKSEYEKKSKAVEMEQLKTNIANATVTSEIAGVVKAIHDGTGNQEMMNGESQAFMTIVATGDFKIKGSVNEQNISAIVEGTPVIIRSRVDDTKSWTGTYGKVDIENPKSNNNNGGTMVMMGGQQDAGVNNSSSYSFYVNLDSSEGLMLGQHVYLEADQGQGEVKTGVWIDAGFINDMDEKPYVWTDNGKSKIEKREVKLGAFDENLNQYEITEGLSQSDAIAFAQESIKEGAPTVKNGMNEQPVGEVQNETSQNVEFQGGEAQNSEAQSGATQDGEIQNENEIQMNETEGGTDAQ